MKVIRYTTIAYVFCLFSSTSIAETVFQKRTNFSAKSLTLTEMARSLSRAQSYGIAVCSEDFLGADVFTISVTNETLDVVMSNLTTVVTNCVWAYDDKLSIINIFPKRNSLLNWSIDKIDVKGLSFEHIIMQDDYLKLRQHGITFFPGRGNLEWLKTPITVKAEGLTAKEALNMICKQLPFKARWELQHRVNKNKTTGELSIRGCY